MPTISREALKHVALIIAGLIAVWGMFVIGWCALQKIYIDVPMLLVLSNIVTGIASSITTLLVGRTLSQLNSNDGGGETTMTQTTQTTTKPKAQPKPPSATVDALTATGETVKATPTVQLNPPENPANVTEVPKP